MKPLIKNLRQQIETGSLKDACNSIKYLRDHLSAQDFHDLTKDLSLPRGNAGGCLTIIVLILIIIVLWI